jgi:hypothetical protein
MAPTGGFRLYHAPPGEEVWNMVWEGTDPTQREMVADVPVEEGLNRYAMTSYSGEDESPKSEEYPYEWLKPQTPSGLPIPTVIIQFGSPQ